MVVELMGESERKPKAALRPMSRQLGSWSQAALAVLVMLGVLRPDGAILGFVAYDCLNSTNRLPTPRWHL
jgi:uncharacterized membrane protein